jgi:hypothetical protein
MVRIMCPHIVRTILTLLGPVRGHSPYPIPTHRNIILTHRNTILTYPLALYQYSLLWTFHFLSKPALTL